MIGLISFSDFIIRDLNNKEDVWWRSKRFAHLGLRGARSRKPFTLIELLVVVTILMVLASLLAPAMQSALGKSRRIQCVSQLRQVGMGASGYADDYDGMLLSAFSEGDRGHWLNYLYVESMQKNEKMFQCPSLGSEDFFNPYGGKGAYGELTSASYIMNVIREQSVYGWSKMNADISTDYNHSFGYTRGLSSLGVPIERVRQPESRIYITDSAPELTHSSTAIGILRLSETDHGIIDTNGNGSVNAGERQVGFQHDLGYNALFGDLHVEFRTYSKHEDWNAYQE